MNKKRALLLLFTLFLCLPTTSSFSTPSCLQKCIALLCSASYFRYMYKSKSYSAREYSTSLWNTIIELWDKKIIGTRPHNEKHSTKTSDGKTITRDCTIKGTGLFGLCETYIEAIIGFFCLYKVISGKRLFGEIDEKALYLLIALLSLKNFDYKTTPINTC